jgi:hypothetical protein
MVTVRELELAWLGKSIASRSLPFSKHLNGKRAWQEVACRRWSSRRHRERDDNVVTDHGRWRPKSFFAELK